MELTGRERQRPTGQLQEQEVGDDSQATPPSEGDSDAVSPPRNDKPPPQQSKEDEDPIANQVTQTGGNPLPTEGEKIEPENREIEEKNQEGPEDGLDIGDLDDPTERLISLMNNGKFMDYLQYARVELYKKLISDDVSQDAVDEASMVYSEWMEPVNDLENGEKAGTNKEGGGGGGGSKSKITEAKAKGGTYVRL